MCSVNLKMTFKRQRISYSKGPVQRFRSRTFKRLQKCNLPTLKICPHFTSIQTSGEFYIMLDEAGTRNRIHKTPFFCAIKFRKRPIFHRALGILSGNLINGHLILTFNGKTYARYMFPVKRKFIVFCYIIELNWYRKKKLPLYFYQKRLRCL